MGSPSASRHETFAIATMHAKERAVARPFSRWLGAAVTVAPGCAAPGFGIADVVRGLPCGWCSEPTRLVIAEPLRCASCGFENQRAVEPEWKSADPGQCQYCNP